MGTLNRLIRKTHGPLKSFIYKRVPFGYRYGPTFRRTLREVTDRDTWSLIDLFTYQREQLSLILQDAYTAPFYRRIFDTIKVGLTDIKLYPSRVLEMMPVLTRQDVRENGRDLITSYGHSLPPSRVDVLHTSGSTGQALMFCCGKELYEKEAAFQERAWLSHGPSLYFGRSVWIKRWIPSAGEPLFYEDKERQWLCCSPYHISLGTIAQYVNAINAYKAPCLVGYPSSIYILALALREANLRLPHIRSIHVASEMALPQWKETVFEIMGVPMKTHYGMMEKSAFFHQCRSTNEYHESVDYGMTEITSNNRVLITGFLNRAQPFIKYQIGDMATRTRVRVDCPCGSKLPITVSSFDGRSDDILVAPDGRRLPPVNFYTMFYRIYGVRFFQIRQPSSSTLLVSVVPEDDARLEALRIQILASLRDRWGTEGNIELNFVSNIDRDFTSGKFRCIRYEVKEQS